MVKEYNFQELSEKAATPGMSQYHHALFKLFLEDRITVDDINQMMNAKEEHEYWEQFRSLYQEFDEDPVSMLEALRDEETNTSGNVGPHEGPGFPGGGNQDRGRGRPPGLPEHEQQPESLPEPEVPRDRRGRGRPERKGESAIIRVARSIGRRIFRRHK